MYKVASDKRQAALRRGRLADWVDGGEPHVETRTILEQWRDLRAAIQSLRARIQDMPRGMKGGRERHELGRRLHAMQEQLPVLTKQLRAENFKKRDIAEYFMQIAREQLYPAQFKAMFAAALRLKEQDGARADARIAETKKNMPDAEKLIAEAKRLAAEAERVTAETKASKLREKAARRERWLRSQQQPGPANPGTQVAGMEANSLTAQVPEGAGDPGRT